MKRKFRKKLLVSALSLLAGVALTAAPAVYYLRQPVAAVAFAACGALAGAVIVRGDGSMTTLTPKETAAALPQIEKLPEGKRKVLSWVGPQCAPLKVY